MRNRVCIYFDDDIDNYVEEVKCAYDDIVDGGYIPDNVTIEKLVYTIKEFDESYKFDSEDTCRIWIKAKGFNDEDFTIEPKFVEEHFDDIITQSKIADLAKVKKWCESEDNPYNALLGLIKKSLNPNEYSELFQKLQSSIK